MASTRPSRREDFEIAIICALPLEYDAVSLLFDQFWDKEGDQYGRAAGDFNSYTTGRIGKYNVVLALLSRMGKANAASATASIRTSYRCLQLALLVGICGGVPRTADGHEVLLGDVVIGKTIVQYDFGRRYPDHFARKNAIEDELSLPNKNIRNLLATIGTDRISELLGQRTAHFLRQLQTSADKKWPGKYYYPGTAADKLFQSSYRHKHRGLPTCICKECDGESSHVCLEATKLSCDDLQCEEAYLVPRERLETKRQIEQDKTDDAQNPVIHVGPIASGDTVMKSGEDRDRVAKEESVIAFEMEGAGVWDEVPCIIVKGVCDYADCHKNKKWQNFAAATAASVSKAILERYIQADKTGESPTEEATPHRHWIVPFGRNKNFVGREAILELLLQRIPPDVDGDDCQRTAIEGLGGIGKTQIALEAAFRVRDAYPDCSIFWVPAVDATSFENAYRKIGLKLMVEGINEDKADIKLLVKTALSSENSGRWLLIVDNADDVKLIFGDDEATGLCDYLPFSQKGSILFTTRTHEAVMGLDILQDNIIAIGEMSRAEAVELLRRNLKESQTCNVESTTGLLDFLADLPLAIKQASAYMAKTGMSTTKYLDHCRSSDKNLVKLLSKDLEDRGRYKNIKNPVATTWLISFDHILRDNPLAAYYLRFMSFLAEKEIPVALLPPADDELDADEAIGTLKAYAFITEQEASSSLDIHRLVRLAMQNWLKEEGEQESCTTSVMERLADMFPSPVRENKDEWMKYLPHAEAALAFRWDSTDKIEWRLLSNVAKSYNITGKFHDAERIYRHTLRLREKMLGKKHPSTLAYMNSLALVLRAQGKYEEAGQLHRLSFQLRGKVPGEKHPRRLTHMNNLALVLRKQGKYQEAEQMFRQVLDLKREILGKEHLSTLRSMNNLALVLRKLGKYKEAEQIHRQAFELMKEILGSEHPDTLLSMNNLALVVGDQGMYEEAEQMHRQEWNLAEKVLGKEHPDTLKSMNNLAKVLDNQGKYEEAERIRRQALKLKEVVLGKEHPDTLISMNNLAYVLRNRGKYEEAEQMHRKEWKLAEKVIGKEHPDTLKSINNLALVLSEQGKYKDAEQMHRQMLALREKVLGKEHPDTLKSRNNLTNLLHIQGVYNEEAVQAHQQERNLVEEVQHIEQPNLPPRGVFGFLYRLFRPR